MHPIHRRFHAEELVRLRRAGEKRRYVAAQRRGRVDPNPHQIEAVTFALKRIPQGGCILADEVGLGKTIEAGLVIAQLLAEGKSRVLVIVPRPLLGQWQHELRGLFGIEALEAADENVDVAAPGVFLVGREYAGGERGFARLRQAPPFDLCLIDEAHEVFAGIHRRYNKDGSYDEASPHARMAHRVKQLLGISPVLLLTATPMQNSLDELWALVGYIDRTGTLLGDKPTFDALFKSEGDVGAEQAGELQRRLKQVVQRTLRRQAMPYLERPFVGRTARLYHYTMSAAEKALYDDVTEYLLEPELFAFRGSARKLLLLGFHRRMASSNAALAKSLEGVAARLRKLVGGTPETTEDLDDDLEERLEGDDEGLAPSLAGQTHPQEAPTRIPRPDQAAIRAELERVESFVRRAKALPEDSKAESLVKVVQLVLDRPKDRRKVLIFTESLTTQDYLRDLLVRKTPLTEQDITLFRGVNDSPRANAALRVWREKVEAETAPHLRPGPAAAVRLALVHEFRIRSTVMIATEAGAKGLNMQFCDTIVNYDLPWNPQRIEQRIGRCHRYRQQRDVTVFNFLAEDNEAQQLTFDILSGKLDLFGKVLDMTDVVLQTPRSDSSEALTSALGADFEAEVRRIWERARSVDDVVAELRQLRDTMEERRRELDRTRERTIGLIEQRLDASVRKVFERIQDELAPSLKALDDELKGVLAAYLDAEQVPWGEGERDGREVLHYGASGRLPKPLRNGGTVLIGSSRGVEGADPLHVGHPLIEAAVQGARQQCAGEYRVRFRLRPSAPAALRKHRGSRGRLALTRIRYDGFEPEDRLRVTAVFEDAEVLRPADAALELLRQPCEDIAGESGNPLAVSAAHLDEVVDEELFEEQGRVADINQQGFEQAMRQLDQYLADRTLVLQRAKRQHSQRLAAAERRRDQSVGADNRASAEKRVRDLEANIENVEKQLAALASHDDETYQKWKHHAHQRRYATPTGERLLSAEFVIE